MDLQIKGFTSVIHFYSIYCFFWNEILGPRLRKTLYFVIVDKVTV